MRSSINHLSLKKCKIAALVWLGLIFVLEILARCLNGYQKSPSGDCEKYVPHKGLPRCDNGYHRSPSGHCEKVGGSNGSSKKCSSGYQKMKIAVSVRRSAMRKLWLQIKSIAKSTGNSQDQTDVFTTKELSIFSNRTCQGFSGCLKGP